VPRTCSVCGHPQRPEIDQALAAQESYRDIAGRFGTSKFALQRHRHTHAPGSWSPADRLALAAEAWKLHEAALQLSYHPGRVLDLLRAITRFLVQAYGEPPS
jgi:hypothetical protein